jgi:hypothetical protein
MSKRKDKYWKDFSELTSCVRTEDEDRLSREVLKIHKKFSEYLKRHGRDLSGDLQGGIHLLQGILITVQKRRLNLRNKYRKMG